MKKTVKQWSKDIKTSLLKNYQGLLWGSALSLSVSFILWLFAYFGYTDLGLPVRYDYEILNNLIKKELPQRYSYSIDRIKFRDVVSESLLVTARDTNWTSMTDRNIGSDIIFILDKTDKQYTISYKFQPKVNNEYSAPVFIRDLAHVDLDYNGTEELVMGWSYLGASFSPPYITVLKNSDNKNVLISTLPKVMKYKYRPDYPVARMTNIFDKEQSFDIHEAHSFFAKKGELTTLARNDDACNACAEEQIFEIHRYRYEDNSLKESRYSEVETIKSFSGVVTRLSDDGYDMTVYK